MKRRAVQSTKTRTRQRPARIKLVPISDEARHWSAMLEAEMESWPSTTLKPMFGFRSVYRGRAIFAALPHTRSFGSACALILKFNPAPAALLERAQRDARMNISARIPGNGWYSFELRSEDDLRDALWWLNQAYEHAGK